jgi:acyl-CoA hydrolase
MSEAVRNPGDTASVLTYRTGIQDANISGNVHGGWIMKLCDEAAAIAAARHVGARIVTAAVDGMKFRSPVHVGDLLTLRATVNAAWRTSLEVGVRVESENVERRDVRHTCTAFITMVALGEDERPMAIPALVPVTDEERRRCDEANLRREIRLAHPDALQRIRE